nr:MAG TPA: Capsid protein [Microviridae sp.]
MRKRSKFSLSHYRLFSGRMGYLMPIGITECLPGDTFQQATSVFLRCSPLVTPVMHPVHVTVHHWFIPTRLLWDKWEDFITGGPDGMDASIMPTIKAPAEGGFAIGSLHDYLGVPTGIPNLEVCALPARACALLYNECYRDQDLEEPLPLSLESGEDTTTSTELQRCDWARDYFTTARPWPQKGPAVSVPVNLTAAGEPTITGTVTGNGTPTFTGNFRDTPGTAPFTVSGVQEREHDKVTYSDLQYSATSTNNSTWGNTGSGRVNLSWGDPALKVNLQFQSGNPELGSVDINLLREAFALQRFEEHRALYGSRYVEYLRYLGVKSSDARLQRPEYLGGSRQTIQFSEVLQTAPGGDDPVGALKGHGIGAMRTNRYRRFFEEHGYVLTVMMVRPISVYMQGLSRMWNRRVKEDYYQRELQHIGQQEVLTKELYAGNAEGPTSDDTVFGYQNRYDEYRWHESYVSGEFRTILNSWHMARDFANEPTLNADFINAVPTTRIFAAQENDTLYCMANHSIQARRLMSKYGNPI